MLHNDQFHTILWHKTRLEVPVTHRCRNDEIVWKQAYQLFIRNPPDTYGSSIFAYVVQTLSSDISTKQLKELSGNSPDCKSVPLKAAMMTSIESGICKSRSWVPNWIAFVSVHCYFWIVVCFLLPIAISTIKLAPNERRNETRHGNQLSRFPFAPVVVFISCSIFHNIRPGPTVTIVHIDESRFTVPFAPT